MDWDCVEWLVFVVVAFVLTIVLVVLAVSAPCHGGFLDFNEGQFCEDCGEPRYEVCDCGAKLTGRYCTYCGAKNEFLED